MNPVTNEVYTYCQYNPSVQHYKSETNKEDGVDGESEIGDEDLPKDMDDLFADDIVRL